MNVEEHRQGEQLFVPALSSGSGTNEEKASHGYISAGNLEKIPEC